MLSLSSRALRDLSCHRNAGPERPADRAFRTRGSDQRCRGRMRLLSDSTVHASPRPISHRRWRRRSAPGFLRWRGRYPPSPFRSCVCCGVQSGLGQGECVFGEQRVDAGFRAELLFLLGDVEGPLCQVAGLLRGVDTGLRLLKGKLRVPHIEENVLLLLLGGDLALAELRARRGIDRPWPGGCAGDVESVKPTWYSGAE